jgi:predicted lysophospholipase L1 biosynthesis ABC-type transport system permease subunit
VQDQKESKPEASSGEAAKQVAGAHALLKVLEAKIGEHPEIGQAILKLETALNILGLETGAML